MCALLLSENGMSARKLGQCGGDSASRRAFRACSLLLAFSREGEYTCRM